MVGLGWYGLLEFWFGMLIRSREPDATTHSWYKLGDTDSIQRQQHTQQKWSAWACSLVMPHKDKVKWNAFLGRM